MKGRTQMKQIIIDVFETGEIEIETRGYIGRNCIEESQVIKDLLGNEITKQLTPSYFSHGKKNVKKHLPLCG